MPAPLPTRPAEISLGDARLPTVRLDPETLRARLVDGNSSVLLGANRVHQAKEQVNIARGHLLPSLNLGLVFMASGSPTFALGAIEALFPFLVPSRWFDYRKAKHLLEAEKVAYLLLQLNQYASAYSLYLTVLNDSRILDLLALEVEQFEVIERRSEISHGAGLATTEDLAQARSQTALARMRRETVESLLHGELASLRAALGIPLDHRLVMVRPISGATPALPAEAETIAAVRDRALRAAPESAQLTHLGRAARAEKWDKVFGFTQGVSLSSRGVGGGGAASLAFSALSGVANVSIGFSLLPGIRLTERQQDEVELRRRELGIEVTEAIESTLLRLEDARERARLAALAESSLEQVFLTKVRRYELGAESFLNVIFARSQLREASLERVRAETETALLRLSLERSLVEGQFAAVRGCPTPDLELAQRRNGGGRDFFMLRWFKGILGRGGDSRPTDWTSVEEICGAGADAG